MCLCLGAVWHAGRFQFSAPKGTIRIPVEVRETFACYFLVGGVVGCVRFASDVRPCKPARGTVQAFLGFGFQAHHEAVSVRELAFALAFLGQPAYALVGVGSTGVTPNPRLLGVSSYPNCVSSRVFLRHDIVVMIHVVWPHSMHADVNCRCISRIGNFK